MYSDIFSKLYDAFGWNYYPESFAQLLLRWIDEQGLHINHMLDLGCGTGILCNMIAEHGIEAMGMDLSHGMIAMAKQNYPHIVFKQGNMIDWKPEMNFDLVTSTCDAINHILEPEDVKKVMKNVYSYLNQLKEGDTINLTVKRDGKKMDISYKSDTNVRYLLGCNFNGDDTSAMTVESVMDGMPLQEAGIQQGDVITSINGVKITNAADYQKYIQENPLTEKSVKITYSRDGQEYDITVTPKEYRTAESGFTYNMYSEKAKGLNVVKYGAVEVKYMVRTTILSLKELVSGKLGMKDLSGPVGIVDAIGTTYEESKSEGTMILWMNMLHPFLGCILNIFPRHIKVIHAGFRPSGKIPFKICDINIQII